MMRLQMVTTRPVVWILGDEVANGVRDTLKALDFVEIDVRCYAYTGATLESVMDAQLLMALGSGTHPTAIIVVAGAYDALFSAMGGGTPDEASTLISDRLRRLHTMFRLRKLHNVFFTVYCSLNINGHFVNVGLPPAWAEQVCTGVGDEPYATLDAPAMLETLLSGLGFGKDA